MNLHDWIDELCDVLDLDTEVDESLLADLATAATDNVGRSAGPVATYLLGVAVGARDAGVDEAERLAERAQGLAERWDRPAGVGEDDDDDQVEVDAEVDADVDVGLDAEDVYAR